MTNEVELKLSINKSETAKLKRLLSEMSDGVQISPPLTRKVLSTYYDTPTLTLLDRGISIRLRRASRKWFQTIKATGSALSGLHQRMELESEVANGQLDFSKLTETTYADFFNQNTIQNQIAPIFSTDIQRTEWQLTFDNGDAIELVLDIGQLLAGGNHEPISEIELELKQGNAGRLFEFALQLQQNIPLSIENKSKAHRGYAYYRPQPPAIVKANSLKLRRKMKASEALKQIVQECLMQLQGNQDMVLYGKNIEGVHQMRIALRRLRSALNVFSCVVSKQRCATLLTELKWITAILGHARDLDVFITQTLPPLLNQLQNEPSLVLLAKKAKQERLQAYAKVREALNGQRYQRLLLTLEDWLLNERWKTGNVVERSVVEIAQIMLSKHYKQLKKSGKNLLQAEPEERHAARIAAKKLRYAAEFFVHFYSPQKSSAFISSLSQLQDQLGIMNDISVTDTIFIKLIGHHPPRNMMVAHYLFKGWNAYKLMQSATMTNTSWQKFTEQKPFW
jgi:triphosphatase